jgi:hypothetical protein
MGTTDIVDREAAPKTIPSLTRQGITLFNLALSGISWMAVSSQSHVMTCGRSMRPQTPDEIVAFVLLLVTTLAATVALVTSFLSARWAQLIWRGAQLRLAIVCSGVVAWAFFTALQNLSKAAEPGIGLMAGILTGIAALSIFCAAQVRQYIE